MKLQFDHAIFVVLVRDAQSVLKYKIANFNGHFEEPEIVVPVTV